MKERPWETDATLGEIDPSGTILTLPLQVTTASDLDRTYNLGFHTLCRFYETGRAAAIRNPLFLARNGRRLFEHGRAFTVVTDYYISPEMSKRVRKNHMHQRFILKTAFKDITKSSLILQATLTDPSDNTVLSCLSLKYVFIDMVTRKSQNLPQWFIDDFCDIIESAPKINFAFSTPQPPTDAKVFKLKYQMLPSDTDINGHVNNATYFRLCMDAASLASLNHDHFQGFSGDIAHYICTHATGLYAKECSAGDEVTIHVWEDKKHAQTLHYQIKKENTLSFSATMTFEKPKSAVLTSSKL